MNGIFDLGVMDDDGEFEDRSLLRKRLKSNKNNEYETQKIPRKTRRQRIEYLAMLASQGLELFPEIRGLIEYKNEDIGQIDRTGDGIIPVSLQKKDTE